MNSLRRRVAFKASDDDEADTTGVLDDQQQDEVIQSLQAKNQASNEQYLLLARVLVAMSTLMHLFCAQRNPLVSIFPTDHHDPVLSAAPLFSLLSLAIHLALAARLFPREINQFLATSAPPTVPFRTLYGLSLLGPALALCTSKPWQTVAWWLFNTVIVMITQLILDAVDEGNNSILELQQLKYTAPGA